MKRIEKGKWARVRPNAKWTKASRKYASRHRPGGSDIGSRGNGHGQPGDGERDRSLAQKLVSIDKKPIAQIIDRRSNSPVIVRRKMKMLMRGEDRCGRNARSKERGDLAL